MEGRKRLATEVWGSELLSLPRGVPLLCVLMFLSLAAWEPLQVVWLPIVLMLAGGAFLLGLLGTISLWRMPGATEPEEPRRLARYWLIASVLWSLGLLYASVWLGTFEAGWEPFFVVTAPLAVLAWIYVIAKLVMNRRRALATKDSRGPRRAAITWLTAATLYCSVLAVFSMRERLSHPMELVQAIVWTAPWFVGVFFVALVLLRQLPASVVDADDRTRSWRRLAITALRAESATVAVILCASGRAMDGSPQVLALVLAGLALLGGVHLALETLIRELPRGARTMWFGSLAAVIAVAAITLVTLHVPRRATFELFRGRFDACVASGREGEQSVGPWDVFVARDPGGSVFLETWSESERIDSGDRLHVGFAHHPEGDSTPFGTLRELEPLGGDWYEFRALGPWD